MSTHIRNDEIPFKDLKQTNRQNKCCWIISSTKCDVQLWGHVQGPQTRVTKLCGRALSIAIRGGQPLFTCLLFFNLNYLFRL